MTHTAIVLGCGLGGLVAAQRLRRRLPDGDRVIAIDRSTEHFFPPSLLWLLIGARAPADISRPLSRLAGRGVDFRVGEVARLLPGERQVEVAGEVLRADALVLALGAEYAPEQVPGLAAAGHNLYTLDGATAARDALARFTGGRLAVLTAAPAYKCPAAPYEAALLVEDALRRRGLRERCEIDFYAAEAQPMVVAGPAVGAAVRGMLEGRGIRYHPAQQVQAVDSTRQRIEFANGLGAEYDLLLFVPPHRAPAVVREAGLCNDSGWVPVDRYTLETRFPGVFALGDVTTIPLAMGRPLPKAGVFAHHQAEVVADNLVHAWTGRGAPRRFTGEGSCFIEIGGGRAGLGKGNFYAEPLPQIDLRQPSRWWHLGKVLYELYWLGWRF